MKFQRAVLGRQWDEDIDSLAVQVKAAGDGKEVIFSDLIQ